MKEITIIVPDNYELKQDGNTYIIVEKEKKLTYEDVAGLLFKDEKVYYVSPTGIMSSAHCAKHNPVNCTSLKQAEKLLAINKLMNVAKWLNDDWRPDWKDCGQSKYYIYYSNSYETLTIDNTTIIQRSFVYFKSKELAKQAIEILGEETIKIALCTDY